MDINVRRQSGRLSNPGYSETGKIWPITKLRWISSNTYPLRVRRCWTIQNKELMPSWRRDTTVRWCSNCASRTRTSKCGENSSSSHRVPVSTGSSCGFPLLKTPLSRRIETYQQRGKLSCLNLGRGAHS
jgi:hypothetical protein